MNRRDFMKTATATSAALALSNPVESTADQPRTHKARIMVWAHADADFVGKDDQVKAEFERISDAGIDIIFLPDGDAQCGSNSCNPISEQFRYRFYPIKHGCYWCTSC